MNNMSKELSIKSIKEELMTAFLDNVKIISTFSNTNIEKVSDYTNSNIFGHLEDDCSIFQHRADAYIYFDVAKLRGYDVMISVKAHRDLIKSKDVVNCVDEISDAIEKIVNELYPYHRCFSSTPRTHKNFVERYIHFKLCKLDKDGYEKSIEAENERVTNEVPRESVEN